MERFGQTQRAPKVSIIVPIYGIADYLFLQSCIYAQGRDIGAYEFIYVVNSPELIETLCREARIAQMIYGLPQTLVALPGNVGFGTANNVGARFARSDRLLCLNPDVFPSRCRLGAAASRCAGQPAGSAVAAVRQFTLLR